MSNLYGLLGQRLSHSLSPKIHEVILKKAKIDAEYKLFEVDENMLYETLSTFKTMKVSGINVTIPYKIAIMKYLDRLSPEVMSIGSVNCISFLDSLTIGYNTDYFGFGRLIERHQIKVNGQKVLVLGYGGAAKTILRYLLDYGIKSIVIAVRKPETAVLDLEHERSGRVKLSSYDALPFQAEGDLIINCTPCGMYPNINISPIEIKVLEKYKTAVDIVYNPYETVLLKQAKAAGLKTANGMYMLVSQAVAAQEIWNSISLSASEVEDIYTIVSEYLLNTKNKP